MDVDNGKGKNDEPPEIARLGERVKVNEGTSVIAVDESKLSLGRELNGREAKLSQT